MFCYCDRDDRIGHETLSLNSDVRVAWGGREAVETVMSLPRKYGTDDVIFGPRYSFAFVGKNSFEKKQLKNIAYNLAIDVSVFEQQGCNSPHTVFVESGCDISPVEFAKALADGMDEVLKRIPKNAISADQAYTIVNTRTEYSFIGKVFSSKEIMFPKWASLVWKMFPDPVGVFCALLEPPNCPIVQKSVFLLFSFNFLYYYPLD